VIWTYNFCIVLSPFLNNGLITEYFNLEGNERDIIDLLQMYFKGTTINGELTLMILTEISSFPYEFLVLRDLMIFSISQIFPHRSIHKCTWTSPGWENHNQTGHILIVQ
jgi:hypothetical protein